ncbi:MFS transporter [Nocardia tengchongensis]|uniref:MFS transporter n=1 Tax=Nocardia tengchongensis TaxID=2055889 RepID=UPI00364C9C9A
MSSYALSDGAEPHSDPPGAQPLRAPSGWTWRSALSLATIVLVLETVAIHPLLVTSAMPAIKSHFDLTGSGWILTSFVLVGAAAAPLAGKLADLHGKRRMLLICMALGACGSLVSAAATGVWVLVLGRSLSGLLVPCLFLGYSLIRDIFPPKTIALAVSISATATSLAVVAATHVTEWLVDAQGFRAVFWVTAIVLGVLAIALTLTTPESPVRLDIRVRGIGAVIVGAALASALIGVSRGPVHGWSAASTLVFLAIAAALFALWLITAKTTEDALIDRRLWRRRPVVLTAVTAGLGYAVVGTYTMLLPMLTMVPAMLGLGYGFGVDAKGVSTFQAPLAVMTIIGGLVVGALVGRGAVEPRLTAMAGMVATTAGCALTAYSHHSEHRLMVFAAVVGLGVGLTYASIPNLLIEAVPAQVQASAAALVGVFQGVIPAIVPIVVFATLDGGYQAELPPMITKMLNGAIVYSDDGFKVGFLIAAAVALLGVLTTLLLPRAVEEADLDSIIPTGSAPEKVN